MRTDKERIDWLEKQFGCALVNDDNGHWCVTWDGIQSVPLEEGPVDVSTTFWVERHQWRNSVREAIDAAMDEEMLETDPRELNNLEFEL